MASVLEKWTHLDFFMRQWAVDRAVDHWDGIVAFYCATGLCTNHNYYWYEESDSDRMWLISWDMDSSLQDPSPIRTFYGMPDWDEPEQNCSSVTVFLGIPARPPSCDDLIHGVYKSLWAKYVEASQHLLDTAFQIETITAKLDRWAEQIRPFVETDPHGPTLEEWEEAVQALRQDVLRRRQAIIQKITGM